MDARYTDNFEIVSLLGQGGVGRVFLGFEKNIGREVAIKEIKPEKLGANKDKVIARFIREAKISGQLQHPGIVPVYEMGKKEDGTIFLVMKHVQGITLHDAIAERTGGPPDQAFRARLPLMDNLIAVAEAVGYAHSMGIIHRDLKPANIILGAFGETIILDWGLAKRISEGGEAVKEVSDTHRDGDNENVFETRQGALVGTPSYMAPEQINPKFGPVGFASDVYALGTLLFMILTGDKPHKGNSRELMTAVASNTPSPSPRSYGQFIPPELAAICEKAMAKTPGDRFKDGAEFAAELRAYRDGRLVSIYEYSKMELFRRFVARNKALISATAAVILAIIVGAAFSVHFAIGAHRAQLRAENALVEVTNLSEGAMALAIKSADALDQYARKTKTRHIDAEEFPKLLPTDPLESDYQVWCMQDDGRIVYDEDPKQVGLMLFSDKLYANFPELLKFGEKIRNESMGVSYYSFLSKDEQNVIYKVAAWDTVRALGWKIVVTHPYMTK